MPKTITLEQTGWYVNGYAVCFWWGGGKGTATMDATFIPCGSMTKKSLVSCVNDGGQGSEHIESATLRVGEVYGGYPGAGGRPYMTNWRTIEIKNPDHSLVKRGI